MVIIDIIRLNYYKFVEKYLNSHNSLKFVLLVEMVIIDIIKLNCYKIRSKWFK
jgi:hypothetical protein